MSTPSDYSASVLARLLNHSRSHKENYQSLLIRYVIERFLYRLGQSEYKDSFVLKGAHLLTITFENQTYRTTKDIDLHKSGDTQPEMIRDSLEAICSIPYPEDGVIFDTASIRMHDIREQNTYHGHRTKIDYKTVKNAIKRTFERRSTPIPKKTPVVFSEKVYNDDTKVRQWKAFVSKLRNEHSDLRFPDVIKRLQAFTEVFFRDDSTKLSSWIPERGWS